ncbi:MAG TPA: isoprenylcysteine carboxylmethyltransferase family protein [Gammaproteobacteria bacterium]
MSARQSEGLVTPPPLIYLGFILIGVGLNYQWPWSFIIGIARYVLGVATIVVSIAIFVWVLTMFSSARTSVDHRKPTTALITSGPFRYSRNPIYVSMTLLSAGIAVVTSNFWILLMTLPAVITVHFLVILREEAFLKEKFGDRYLQYCASVRRWI